VQDQPNAGVGVKVEWRVRQKTKTHKPFRGGQFIGETKIEMVSSKIQPSNTRCNKKQGAHKTRDRPNQKNGSTDIVMRLKKGKKGG